jgi:hypothetical protein
MLSQQIAETKEEYSAPHTALERAGRRALYPVLLQYAIAQYENKGLRLLSAPVRFREEGLIVFSSWDKAQGFLLSGAYQGEWHVRECSAGELVSLLLGLHKDSDWVLLNPLPAPLVPGETSTNLARRETFVNYLLGNENKSEIWEISEVCLASSVRGRASIPERRKPWKLRKSHPTFTA